jgi:hypothetical protein
MDKRIDKIKKVRQFLIEQVANLTDEQLNKIPKGYNNNIIWNLINLISIQQGLCYFRATQKAKAPDKFITPFSNNTKPDRIIEHQEIAEVKSLLITTIDELQKDYDKKIFQNYTVSPNIFKVYGIEIKDIDDALEFLLYHEGYHTGYILCLKKLVD